MAYMGRDASKGWKRVSRLCLTYRRKSDGVIKRMDWGQWTQRMSKEEKMVYLKEALYLNPEATRKIKELSDNDLYDAWMEDPNVVPFELFGRLCDRCHCTICKMHSLVGNHARCIQEERAKEEMASDTELSLNEDDAAFSSLT